MKTFLRTILVALFLLPAVTPAADSGPADVVQAFNRAISARKLDDALALMAKGSVQYTLRSAHAGVPTGTGGITSDLATHWSTITQLLFTVTTSYQRVPKILDAHIDGDLATVWANVATDTVERNGKQRQDSFSEVYLLVRTGGGGWQIGSIADNRGTDRLPVKAPAAPLATP